MFDPEAQITTLLQRWRDGDRNAYDALWELIYPRIKQIAQTQRRKFKGRQVPRTTDLTHQVYERLLPYERKQPWKNRSDLQPFLHTVFYRRLIDLVRAQNAKIHGGDIDVESVDHMESQSIPAEADIDLALRNLGDALKEIAETDSRVAEVLCLNISTDLTATQIGQEVGVSRSSVYEDLKIGKAMLLALLET